MNKIIPKYNNAPIKYGCRLAISYVSLINPFILSNYSFENYKRLSVLKPNQKIYVKQSYMILTWFYYLNFVFKKKKLIGTKSSNLKFFIAPKTKKKFTITKAPIAHKKNSKEQILFTFFRFKASINLYESDSLNNYFFYTSSEQTLLSILLSKKTISLNETNLLTLQKKNLFLTFIDPLFFSYK